MTEKAKQYTPYILRMPGYNDAAVAVINVVEVVNVAAVAVVNVAEAAPILCCCSCICQCCCN